MKTYFYDFIVRSYNLVDFLQVLGKFGVRFELSDVWNVVDQTDPNKKNWYRAVRVHATKKLIKEIYGETRSIVYTTVTHV